MTTRHGGQQRSPSRGLGEPCNSIQFLRHQILGALKPAALVPMVVAIVIWTCRSQAHSISVVREMLNENMFCGIPQKGIPYIGTKIRILPLFSHNSKQKTPLNKPRVQIHEILRRLRIRGQNVIRSDPLKSDCRKKTPDRPLRALQCRRKMKYKWKNNIKLNT